MRGIDRAKSPWQVLFELAPVIGSQCLASFYANMPLIIVSCRVRVGQYSSVAQ